MAVTNDLLVKIQADTSQAVAKISELEKIVSSLAASGDKSSKTFSSFAISMGKLGGSTVVLNQAIELAKKGFEVINVVFGETVSKYYAAADGIKKLETALRLTGSTTAVASSKAFKALGEEIERTTSFQADNVVQIATSAKVMGLSDAMTRKLIRTSADLSAATGRDLNGSFQALAASLKGNARGLAEVDPRLTKMSEANLRAGKAVDFLSQRLRGFADEQATTFIGRLQQTKNAIESIYQTIGEIISKGLRLDENSTRFRDFILSIKSAVESARPTAIAFIRVFADADWKSIAAAALEVAAAFVAYKAALVAIDFVGAIRAIGGVSSAISAMGGTTVILTSVSTALKAFGAGIWAAMSPILTGAAIAAGIIGIVAAVEIVIRNFDHLQDVLKIAGDAFDLFADTGARALNWISLKLSQLGLTAVKVMETLSGKKFDKAESFFGQAIEDANKKSIEISKRMEMTVSDMKKRAKGIDWGNTGAVVKFISQLMNLTSVEAEKELKKFAKGNANTTPDIGLSDAQQQQILNFQKMALDLKTKMLGIDADEFELLRLSYEQQLQQLLLQKTELERKGEFVGGVAEAWGKALGALKDYTEAEKKAKIFSGLGIGKFVTDVKNAYAPGRESISSGVGTLKSLIPQGVQDQVSQAIGSIDFKQLTSGIAGAVGDSFSQVASVAADFLSGTADVAMGVVAIAVKAPELILAAVGNLSGTIQGLLDFPVKLIDALGNLDRILQRFIEKFPDALSGLAKKLPDILKSLVAKIPDFIKALLERIPDLVEGLAKAAPIISAMLIKQAPSIAIAMARAFIRAIVAGLKGVFDGVTSLFSGKGFKFKPIDAAAASAEIKKIASQLTSEASKVFAVLEYSEAGKRADSLISQIEAAGKEMRSSANDYWRNIVKATADFFSGAGRFLSGIGPAFSVAWKGLEDSVGPFFKGIADLLSSIFNGITGGIGKAIEEIVDAFKSIGGFVWDGLKSAFSKLGDLLHDIISALNPSSILEKVFSLPNDWSHGRGAVERLLGIDVPFANFAYGGIVPGQPAVRGDSILNDKILALLSPGEAVIPRSMMERPGVRSLVDAVMSGDAEALNLKGGIFGGISKAFSQVTNPLEKMAGAVWNNLGDAARSTVRTFNDVLKVSFDAIKEAATILGSPIDGLMSEVSKRVAESLKSMVSANAQSVIGFSSGGLVPGSGLGDSVPSLLTPGEFVMNRGAVRNIGLPALQALNTGSSVSGKDVTVNQNIEVTINTSEKIDENVIRSRIIPAIKKELKRASLDGQFVVAQSGVR